MPPVRGIYGIERVPPLPSAIYPAAAVAAREAALLLYIQIVCAMENDNMRVPHSENCAGVYGLACRGSTRAFIYLGKCFL